MVNTFPLSLMELFELISTLALLIALVYTIRSFQKNARINEAIFVKDLFEAFQRDRWAVLDNPEALQVLAEERETTPSELIKESIGSFDINRAYLVYHLYERKLTPENQWVYDIQDIRALFTDKLVLNKWEKVRGRFPHNFQQFIDTEILTE